MSIKDAVLGEVGRVVAGWPEPLVSRPATDRARANFASNHMHFLRPTSSDPAALRRADRVQRYPTFVSGSTLVACTDLTCAIRFSRDNHRGGCRFPQCLRTCWIRVYSSSQFNLVLSGGTTFGHTRDISNTEVLSTSTISHWGPPHETEMPTS